MGMTPNEIRNQSFSKSLRGYTPREIEIFRETVAAALEEARADLLKATEERENLRGRYEDLKNLEETIKNVVIEAQRNAEQILANAKKEGDLIVEEARNRRDQIIGEKHQYLAELDGKIHEFEYTRRSFYTRLRAEIEAHLKLLEQINLPRREEKPSFAETTPSPIRPEAAPEPGTSGRDDIDRIAEQFRQEVEGKEE